MPILTCVILRGLPASTSGSGRGGAMEGILNFSLRAFLRDAAPSCEAKGAGSVCESQTKGRASLLSRQALSQQCRIPHDFWTNHKRCQENERANKQAKHVSKQASKREASRSKKATYLGCRVQLVLLAWLIPLLAPAAGVVHVYVVICKQ